jgi:gamma-tubulin complex component 3
MLAVLESQMSLTNVESAAPAEGSGLTLLRLGLWTEDMKLKLRLMEMVVDDATSGYPYPVPI